MLDFLPDISIESIELATADDDRTSYAVTVVVRDRAKEQFTGEWVSSGEVLKYVDIHLSIHDTFISFQRSVFGKQATAVGIKNIPLSSIRGGVGQFLVDVEPGVAEYQIPLQHVFFAEKSPFIGVIAHCKIDKEAIAADFSIPHDQLEMVPLDGRRHAEIIVLDGEVVGKTYALVLPNGSLWSGEIHVTDAGLVRTGPRESEDSVTLTVAPIPNYKIKDYRVFEVPEVAKEADFPIVPLPYPTKTSLVTAPPDLFTKFKVSLDSLGRSQFVFGVDRERALRESSKNSFIYDNMTTQEREKVFDRSAINRVSVTRERVRGKNSAFRNFSFGDGTTMVAEAFRRMGRLVNSVDHGNVSEIGLFDGLEDEGQVAHLTGIDYDIANETTGEYRYSVEMEILDPTGEIITEMVDSLESARLFLVDYIAATRDPRLYSPIRKKFTSEFYLFYDESEINENLSRSISSYLKAKRWLGDPSLLRLVNRKIISTKLAALLGPRTATEFAIQSFLNEVKRLVLHAEVKTGENFSSDQYVNVGSAASAGQQSTAITLRKTFRQTIDVDRISNVAATVLFEGPSDDTGLGVISVRDYYDRAAKETLKYLPSVDADVSLATATKTYTKSDTASRTALSYLSPLRIESKDQEVKIADRGSKTYSTKDSTNLVRSLSASPLDYRATVSKITTNDEKKTFTDLTLRESSTSRDIDQERVERPEIQTDLAAVKDGRASLDEGYDLSKESNLIDSRNLTEDDVLGLPNQLKSAFLSIQDPSKVRLNLKEVDLSKPGAYDMFYLHYENLAKVMVFVGYKEGLGGKSLLQNEGWVVLDESALGKINERKGKNRFVLCRLERYENPKLEIKADPGTETPFYDGYFLIDVNELDDFVETTPIVKPPTGDVLRRSTDVTLAPDPRAEFGAALKGGSEIKKGVPENPQVDTSLFDFMEPQDEDLQGVIRWEEITKDDPVKNQTDTTVAVMKDVDTKDITTYPLVIRRRI